MLIDIIWSNTGESFTGRCLSICKDGAIESIECELDNILSYFLVDFLLGGFLVEDTIEGELILGLFVFDFDGFLVDGVEDGLGGLLFFIEGSDSEIDTDVVLSL